MSTKTLTTSVTDRDPKGLKFLEVAAAAYNKAGLNEQEAQRVNQAPGLSDLIAAHIAQHRHEVPPILKLVADKISVAGSKRLVVDAASLKEANVGFTGSNFDRFFLGKVEENIEGSVLAIHRLEKRSVDGPIRKELGREREQITMTHFFALLKKQSQGQTGPLLTNGYANIAYILDKDGNPWAVRACWYSGHGYWDVNAYSVEDPHEWLAGRQLVSRDC